MKHFSEEDCADFYNQMVAPERRAEMESHLKKGCKKCQTAMHFWQGMKELGGQESANTPDGDSVRLAIGTSRSSRAPSATWCFPGDCPVGFRQPARAGSGWCAWRAHAPCRRLMFRAGEVMIDLSMEVANRRSHVLLVGQVLDTATSGIGIGKVPIHLLNGRDTLAETQTNSYGEFQLECSENKNLQISIGVTENKDVFIPLDEVRSGKRLPNMAFTEVSGKRVE